MVGPVLYDNHSSVIQIANTLLAILASLNYVDKHLFTGYDDRLNSICKLINIEHLNVVDSCNLVEVEVSRNEIRSQFPGQLDQLNIHLRNVFKISELWRVVIYLYIELVSNLIENVESASATHSLKRIA